MTEDEAKRTPTDRLDLASADIAAQKRDDLLRLFPEVRSEAGKLDFERLRLVLGEAVNVGRERYGMNWPGKADCFKTIQTPSMATLRPCPEESVNWSTTENLIIEGDNLEVLKLLQKSYLGKIKLIYIDPPYNTGNDFIYPDNYTESLQTYLEYTGQVDAEGRKFGTNTQDSGRFHSRWLNMMLPRLYLARNLLREDGVLLVSCDDSEVHHLRELLNEVFGEENFAAQFVWKARQFTDTRATTNISTDHEYILAFAKGPEFAFRGTSRDESKFTNPDDDSRGPWMSRSMLGLATREERPNLHYDIIEPNTGRVFPPNPATGWRYSAERMRELISDGRVLFPAKDDGRPREKKFRRDMKSEFVAFRSVIDGIHTADGTQELRELFGEEVFPFPKPAKLIKTLVQQITEEEDYVLDFFAGSGSTAHATLDANRDDAGSRKFILVQLPEKTGRADFHTIADITKERVRRVISKQASEAAETLLSSPTVTHAAGFRVFKLDRSNFDTWNATTPKDAPQLEQQMALHIEHIRVERSEDDLLYEILLKCGFALATPIEQLTLAGKRVFSVAGGALLLCLERSLTMEVIRAIADKKPERVVCLDAGFAGNDQLKTNAVQIFKTKGVGSFKTV